MNHSHKRTHGTITNLDIHIYTKVHTQKLFHTQKHTKIQTLTLAIKQTHPVENRPINMHTNAQ